MEKSGIYYLPTPLGPAWLEEKAIHGNLRGLCAHR